MAKFITDENIRLNLIINGSSAQKELHSIESSTRKLNAENKEYRSELKKIEKELGKNSTEYKELNTKIKENNATIKENKLRMEQLQQEIGVTGLTMGQLSQRASVLKTAIRNSIPGSGISQVLRKELRAVQARMDELSYKAQKTKLSLSSLADGFNKYAAMGASFIAVGTGVVLSLQKMIDYNGKLSDAQSDVQKTTGMTKDEVDQLTKSFGALETRTSRIDLLKIAEEGGRIGIAANEIGAFVNVMNKANVALGDSFTGGVEEVASKLGKLKILFTETKEIGVDQAYNAIGSAINELGANGVATESNIADFATRVGSLPDAIKPSIQDALALGAAFEESGIQAEVSGRGYNIFLKQAAVESAKFAKVMGITTQEVEDMINTNPTEFFLTFSEGLKGMNATTTAKTLKELGINADGANKIVGAAGNNIDRFRTMLDISNKSMASADSLTNEYAIKNNNLAAVIDKVSKRIRGLYSSATISEGLNNFIIWFGKFIGAVEDVDGKTTVWRNRLIALVKTVLILATAIISYNTALKLSTLWTTRATVGTASYNLIQKITSVTTNTLTAATLLGKAAYFALTGQLAAARTAMIAFNLVTKLSPLGLVVGIVSAAAVAYYAFSESTEQATTKQGLLNNAIKETSTQINSEKEELKLLLEIARDENQSLDQREKAIARLNKIVPEYNGNLSIETINTLATTDALNKYIEAKEREVMADILLNDWKKKVQAQKEAENTTIQENISWLEKSWNALKTGGNYLAAESENYKTVIKNKKENIAVTKQEAELARQVYQEYLKKKPTQAPGGSTGPKEGDQQVFGNVLFVFKNGNWVKKELPDSKSGEGTTAEEKAIIASKQRIKDFLIDFENDEKLRKELLKFEEEQREEEEAVMRAEAKYQKMAEDAGYETIEAAGLEYAKLNEIDKIRNEFDAKALADKKEHDDKLLKQDQKNKEIQIKAEQDLQAAKRELVSSGLGVLMSFMDQSSDLFKAMFLIQKGVAIADVIMNGISERAKIAAVWGWNPAIATPMLLTSKIRTGINVASIAATAIQGFEDGLYPVIREQDKKMFNAVYGGDLQTGLVSKPTVFNTPTGQILTGEKGPNEPELIIAGDAYKQISPDIKFSLHRELARVRGFETGLYNNTQKTIDNNVSSESTGASNNYTQEEFNSIITRNTEILEKIYNDGVYAVFKEDLKSAKRIQDKINEYNALVNKNKK